MQRHRNLLLQHLCQQQLHKLNEFVSAYAEMCENAKETDIWNKLKEMYHFNNTGEVSNELVTKIIHQVETWYKKKKEAN